MADKPPPKKKPSNQTMVSLGLYAAELEAVKAVMDKHHMTQAAAIRWLIRNGAVALDD